MEKDIKFLTDGIQRCVKGEVLVLRKPNGFMIYISQNAYNHRYVYYLPYTDFIKYHALEIIHRIIDEYRQTVIRDFIV